MAGDIVRLKGKRDKETLCLLRESDDIATCLWRLLDPGALSRPRNALDAQVGAGRRGEGVQGCDDVMLHRDARAAARTRRQAREQPPRPQPGRAAGQRAHTALHGGGR